MAGKPTATASAVPAVPLSQIAVSVENGSGIDGRAGTISTALISDGLNSQTSASTAPALAATSSLSYGAGDAGEAHSVAQLIGLPSKDVVRAGAAA
ncbi:LytR C-terminal domain-containing protein [Streptacidiphilus sp. 4-A2]|nr:LytR C-terminal domain-containing protein [Streptacidiphilus sp. 4-A2]